MFVFTSWDMKQPMTTLCGAPQTLHIDPEVKRGKFQTLLMSTPRLI